MSRLIAGVLVSALLVFNGCGSGVKLYPVTGTILVDGAPRAKLIVTFTPIEGGLTAVGLTNEKGEYRVASNGRPGAIQGQHKVSITTQFEPAAPPKSNPTGPSGGADYMNQAAIRPQEFKKPKETIPAKYNTNTELVRMVDAQETKFDFEISTKEK